MIQPSLAPIEPVRVLVAEGHKPFRAGLRLLIDCEPTMAVVAEADSYDEAIALAQSQKPDVIVLDLVVNGESGLDYIPKLRDVSPDTRILILTGITDSSIHQQAVKLGAIGVVLKNQEPGVLIKAIEKVHSGEVWIDRATIASLLDDMSRQPNTDDADPVADSIDLLTKRETEIIPLVAQGLKNKDIAERLCISHITVRHHVTSIYGKLGVADRFELIIFAFKHGLCEAPQSVDPI